MSLDVPDWWKLTKFVQFAYRRMFIPGTNLSPYMVARGRQPSLPSDLECLQKGDALPTGAPLNEHVKTLTEQMKLASALLLAARKQQLLRSRESFNQHQIETHFEVGERVRLHKRVGIRRDDELRTGEIASKFKLFNTIYEIVSRQGNNYTIRDVATGREVPANVSQIARMRSDPVEPEEDQVQLDSEQVWRKLKDGMFVLIWVKEDDKSVLKIMEVLEADHDGQQLLGWWYISIATRTYDPELPLVERRLTPEWAERSTQRRVKAPKAGAEDKYEKIFGEFRFAEIELIAVFHLPGSGKIPDKVCELADVWLRRAVKQGTQRCVLALSFPNYQEEKLRESLRKLKLRK